MYCYHCGKKIKESPALADLMTGDENTQVAFVCPRCGHLIHEGLTEENAKEILGCVDGIIVPGGFGSRGIEGMIIAAKYAREHNVPYFGICLGMQIAVIEYARNAAGI